MKYSIELNINNLNERLVEAIKNIAIGYDFNTFYHGYDRLVIESKSGKYFFKLIDSLSNVCRCYNVDYVSLLDLN